MDHIIQSRIALAQVLCKALGLDPSNIRSLTLRLHAIRAPELEVEHFVKVTKEHITELSEVLERFTLIPASEARETLTEEVKDGEAAGAR